MVSVTISVSNILCHCSKDTTGEEVNPRQARPTSTLSEAITVLQPVQGQDSIKDNPPKTSNQDNRCTQTAQNQDNSNPGTSGSMAKTPGYVLKTCDNAFVSVEVCYFAEVDIICMALS